GRPAPGVRPSASAARSSACAGSDVGRVARRLVFRNQCAIVGQPQQLECGMQAYDWNAIVDGLNRYLRLRSIPIGMKLFETVEAMEAIPKLRRPRARHTTDQIVAQARQLGWTVGITMVGRHGAHLAVV